MTKCKRKLLPAEPYEIDALESWFSDLSAEGLHVQKANALFATFIEGEKKRLLFRMEPKQAGAFSTLDKIKAEERHAQHKEKGWSFVCKLDHFYVYAAEEATADYFATPEEEGAYYPDSLKGNKFFNFIHIENLLLVVLIAAYIFILHRQTIYDRVEGFANPFCNLPVLVFAILAGRRSRGFVKLQRSLAAGAAPSADRLADNPSAAEASVPLCLRYRDDYIPSSAVSTQCIFLFRPTDCRGEAAFADDFSGGAGK